jgi:hypothetical protein
MEYKKSGTEAPQCSLNNESFSFNLKIPCSSLQGNCKLPLLGERVKVRG